MKFEEKLKNLRKFYNMNQEELAEKLSVSRQAVSKWENGQGYPETENLIVISKIFDVTVDYLIKEDDTMDIEFFNNLNAGLQNKNAGEINNEKQNSYSPDLSFNQDVKYSENVKYIENDGTYGYEEHKNNNYVNIAELPRLRDFYWMPVAATALYLIVGALFNMWHPWWLIIPIAGGLFPFINIEIPMPHYLNKSLRRYEWIFPAGAFLYLILGFFFNLWHPMWVIFPALPAAYLFLNSIY